MITALLPSVPSEETVNELGLTKPEIGCPRPEVWDRDEKDVVGQSSKAEGGFNERRQLDLV
jgi:hypothetical protein